MIEFCIKMMKIHTCQIKILFQNFSFFCSTMREFVKNGTFTPWFSS